MNTVTVPTLTQVIVDLLVEAYDGPPDAHSPTWFNDNDPNAGILGQIKPLTAVQASHSADGTGNPGTTVASHVEHLRWSLANANGAMRGEPYETNWSTSWSVIKVSESEWNRLRDQLKKEYQDACKLIAKQETLESEYLYGGFALVPHAAYHLATIRQIIERVREKP